jgi:hypothetical protein
METMVTPPSPIARNAFAVAGRIPVGLGTSSLTPLGVNYV